MTNFLPDREIREPNSSALVAAYWILRRQPWNLWVSTTWGAMRRFLLMALIATSLGALLLPAAAQARTYDAFNVDVPFKFNIGNRTFRPGHYQFVFVGTGLLALRDEKKHVIASLIYRPIETGTPSPTNRLVFKTRNKHSELARICLENRTQAFEIMEEELAMRPAPPPASAAQPQDFQSLFDRRSSPAFKQ